MDVVATWLATACETIRCTHVPSGVTPLAHLCRACAVAYYGRAASDVEVAEVRDLLEEAGAVYRPHGGERLLRVAGATSAWAGCHPVRGYLLLPGRLGSEEGSLPLVHCLPAPSRGRLAQGGGGRG
eukprot:6370146-Amphidinium_carterae.1